MQKRYKSSSLIDDKILTEFDEFKPFGRHIGERIKIRNDSGDITVKSGMRTEEVEISDKESDGGNSAKVGGKAGSRNKKNFDEIFL